MNLMKLMSNSNKSFYEAYSENTSVGVNEELVFKNTNLSVFYIGSLLSTESKTSIIEDYPYLTVDDLKYAKLHYNMEVNKKPEELAPNFDPIQNTINKFRNISQKKGSHNEM